MAAGGSYWQRKKPKLGRWLLRLGVLCLVLFLSWLVLAPPLAERIAHRQLRLMGLQPGELKVQHLGWSKIRIGPATLLDGHLNVQSIRIDYRFSELLRGRVRQVRIDRLQWQVSYEQGQWTTGLEQMVSRPPATDPSFPIDDLFIARSSLILTVEGQSVLIPFELSAEQIAQQVHLAVDSSSAGRGLRGTGTLSPGGEEADIILGFLPQGSASPRPQARLPLDPADALLFIRWREDESDGLHDPLSPPRPVGGRLRVRASEAMLALLGSAFGLDQPDLGLDAAWDRQGQLMNLEAVLTAQAAQTGLGRFPDVRMRLNLTEQELSLFGRMGDEQNAVTLSAELVRNGAGGGGESLASEAGQGAAGGDGMTVGLRVKSEGPWTPWLDQLADRLGLTLIESDQASLSLELLADMKFGGRPVIGAEPVDAADSPDGTGGDGGGGRSSNWAIDVPQAMLVAQGLRPRIKGRTHGLDIDQMTLAFSGRAGSEGVRLEVLPQSGLVGRVVDPQAQGPAGGAVSVVSQEWSGFFEVAGSDLRSSRLQLGAERLRVGIDKLDTGSVRIEEAALAVRPRLAVDSGGFDLRWEGVEPARLGTVSVAAAGDERALPADRPDKAGAGWVLRGGQVMIGPGRLNGRWQEMGSEGLTVLAEIRSDPAEAWTLALDGGREVLVGGFGMESAVRWGAEGWVLSASRLALEKGIVRNGAESVIGWEQLTVHLPAEGEGEFELAGPAFGGHDWPAMSGTWRADESGWVLGGRWPVEPDVVVAISGRLGRALVGAGVGMELEGRLPLTRFEPGGRGQQVLSRFAAAEGWELEGGVNGRVSVRYAPTTGLTSSGQVGLSWMNGRQRDTGWAFKGLRGSVVLDDLLGLHSTGSQILEVSSIELGGQMLVSGYAAFRMEGERGIFFDRVHGYWVNPFEHEAWRERVGDGRQRLVTTGMGRLSAHAFRGRAGEPVRLELFVERFNLPAYLDSATARRIGGNGLFFGRLPLALDRNQVQWFDGYLVGEPGVNRLSFRNPELRNLILAIIDQGLADHPDREEILEHLRQMLPHMLYSEARIDIRGGAGPAVAQVMLRARAVNDPPEAGESTLRFSINLGNLVRP